MGFIKMIFLVAGSLSLAACSPAGTFLAPSISCDDRLCSMSENILIDQTHLVASYSSSEVQTQGLLDGILSLTPTLTLVGTLASPLVNGVTVQASDITVNGTKAYVAYNTAGEIQSGAIDVIDVSNPNSVALSSQALYPTMDIHKVTVNSGKLYAAGANGDGSLLRRITLDGSGKLTATVENTPLRGAANASTPAYAGTSVVVSGSSVYALSGNNGGLSVLNTTTLALTAFAALPDARDLAISGSSLNVVTGKTNSEEASIKRFDLSGVAQGSGNYTLTNAVANDQGKSTVQSGSNFIMATAGYGGAKLLCSDGTLLGTAPNPTVSGLTADKTVANAAAFGAGYMFVANGEAGVSIYSINTPLIPLGCSLVTITNLGRFSLGTDASANNVYYSNGYLVVATGSKGFKIIKVTTSVLSGLLQAL